MTKIIVFIFIFKLKNYSKKKSYTRNVYYLFKIKLKKFQKGCLKTKGNDKFLMKQLFFAFLLWFFFTLVIIVLHFLITDYYIKKIIKLATVFFLNFKI